MTPYAIVPVTIIKCNSNTPVSFLAVENTSNHSFTLFLPGEKLTKQAVGFLQLLPFQGWQTLPVHLINPEWDQSNCCRPFTAVFMPDWLVDVTRICHTLQKSEAEAALTLMARYKMQYQNQAVLLGNMCNVLMASLAAKPDQPFPTLLVDLFRQFALSLATLDDLSLTHVLSQLKLQYPHLQHCVTTLFQELQIPTQHLEVEPTYFCPAFGMQGRPDFIHRNMYAQRVDMVELKSGKPFSPNESGINPIHQIQTSLYSLMSSATRSPAIQHRSYLLYASVPDNHLRQSPTPTDGIRIAIETRNSCVLTDMQLCSNKGHKEVCDAFTAVDSSRFTGFLKRDAASFIETYTSLSQAEQAYWHEFGAFLHREHALSRLGDATLKTGQQLLWNASIETKRELGRIAAPLSVQLRTQTDKSTILTLQQTLGEAPPIPFRKGDIAVLYPTEPQTCPDIAQQHAYRCNIIEVSADKVTIQLRTRQHSTELFHPNTYWCLEIDALDSSFQQMYQGLREFASSPCLFRKRYLGILAPEHHNRTKAFIFKNELSAHQQKVIADALNATRHFLVWGPPGTGKTSLVLSEIAWQFLQETTENIMLLAYTNRAVDEICHAILAMDSELWTLILRVGSGTGTAKPYQPLLLDTQLKHCQSRKEIINMLQKKRIFVGTIASISHSPELFTLCQFHTVVIDEASQVLEPMVAGLLSRFTKWIMIGDHLQLPAVTLTSNNQNPISEPLLRELGFHNTNVSVFERFFKRSVSMNWTHTFGILHEQGRMHAALLDFPNTAFYENRLTILKNTSRQQLACFLNTYPSWAKIWQERKLIIHCNALPDSNTRKRNLTEAQACIDCVRILLHLFHANQKKIHSNAIGIISPYKSQASFIQSRLTEVLPIESELITSDTIERFQGSTKDIVIISFSVHQRGDLEGIVSLSEDGIDRKLNVALTRAREQIILIGNTDILNKNKTYASLLRSYSPVTLRQLQTMVMQLNKFMGFTCASSPPFFSKKHELSNYKSRSPSGSDINSSLC